jgi:hypothetical protein
MFETTIILAIGFAAGFGVREWISRQRHARSKSRRG